jgi:hypothetical protein
MARGGHICYENVEFIGVGGLAAMSVLSRILDLRPSDLDLASYNEHTLRIVLSGNNSKFTYIGGQHPHSSPSASTLLERPTTAASKSLS